MLHDQLAIQKDLCVRHYSFKVESGWLALKLSLNIEFLSVAALKLIQLFIKVVLRQFFVGMRELYHFKFAVIKIRADKLLSELGTVLPVKVKVPHFSHGTNLPWIYSYYQSIAN